MACMPIEVVALGEVPEGLLKDAINEANSRQGQFVYSLMTAPDADRFKVFAFNDIYGPDFLNRLVRRFRRRPGATDSEHSPSTASLRS